MLGGFTIANILLSAEQIALRPNYHSQGIGTELILQTLQLLQRELENRQARIKHIIVATRTDNSAQRLYLKTLKALPEVVIPNLFSADEVLMISRNFTLE